MITDSDNIREKRLSLYKDDLDQINSTLKEFISIADANCALLIDKDGYMVTRAGSLADIDMQGVATLVAGSFATARTMARLLGENEFCLLFHEGKKKGNIQINLVGDHCFLVSAFDARTTVGMVRLYAKEATEKLVRILDSIPNRMVTQ